MELTSHLPSLAGKSTAELESLAQELGEEAYRGRQLAQWIYAKQASSFDSMGDLPKALRESLKENFLISPLHIADHKKSTDDVDKLLLHKGDGQVYECVLLPYANRTSCCLSSQVGCPMRCTFCATGLGGFSRNLEISEIVGQYLLLQKFARNRISHVVFMGMGEPLLNLKNLLRSIQVLNKEIGLSLRHVTVSTVGLVPQILELAQEKLPIHLALSLHSPIDSVRSRLMPVNNRWSVQETWEAMRTYQRTTGRKVTVEYLLISGINDTPDQAHALANLVRDTPSFVNLIPFNYVDTNYGFKRPNQSRIKDFREILERHRINVTQRVERGHDIAAACGQLAGQHQISNRSALPLN